VRPTKDAGIKKNAVKDIKREKPGKDLVGGILLGSEKIVQQPAGIRQQTHEEKIIVQVAQMS